MQCGSRLINPPFRRRQPLLPSSNESIHHVAFAPALKRVACHKHRKTGPPPPHWLVLVFAHAMDFMNTIKAMIFPAARAFMDLLLLKLPCRCWWRLRANFPSCHFDKALEVHGNHKTLTFVLRTLTFKQCWSCLCRLLNHNLVRKQEFQDVLVWRQRKLGAFTLCG